MFKVSFCHIRAKETHFRSLFVTYAKKLITNLRKANELFALSSYLLANNRLTKTKEKNEK